MKKRRKKQTGLLPRGKEKRRLEFLGLEAVSLCICLILTTFTLTTVSHYALRNPNVAAVISAVLVDLANGDRAKENINGLTVNPLLMAAAQAKADDMAAKGYFAHESPQGIDPWFWFKQAGYSFDYAGENLAVDFSDSVDVNEAWMNSPLHRDNILNPKYTEIGIATAEGEFEGHHAIFVVQEFGTPASRHGEPREITASVPTTPTKVATARTEPVEEALRETESAQAPNVEGASAEASAVSAPTVVAPTPKPFWAPLVAYPKTMLRYVYYAFAVFILFGLAYVTRFEMRRHHLKHVGAATGLILLMGVLIIIADYLVFVPPVLAAAGISSP